MLYTCSRAAPTPLTVVRRRRPLPLISMLPHTVAVIAVTCGRRSMARASSSVSGRTELGMPVGAGPDVLIFPGEMLTILVPNRVNSASTKRWMPLPIDVSRITAAMPSMVNGLRMRWAASARTARRMASASSMASCSLRQRRVEPRRAARRHHARQQSDDERGAQARRHRPLRRIDRERRVQVANQRSAALPQRVAGRGRGADDRQDDRLDQEQRADGGVGHAQRQRADQAVERGQHRIPGDDGDVPLAVVARHQDRLDLGFGGGDRRAAVRFDEDAKQRIAVEHGLRQRDRHDHQFVGVHAQPLAGSGQHANDAKAALADAHQFAQRTGDGVARVEAAALRAARQYDHQVGTDGGKLTGHVIGAGQRAMNESTQQFRTATIFVL